MCPNNGYEPSFRQVSFQKEGEKKEKKNEGEKKRSTRMALTRFLN